MSASERRKRLLELLRAGGPIRGARIAQELGVSRQAIVNDVAILRAEGRPIIGTPQGYLLVEPESPAGQYAVLACRHDREGARAELSALVEHGVTVLDVVVEHPLYGELRGNLMISTARDVDRFLESLDHDEAELLSALTGGVHLHTVRAPSEQALEGARRALRDAGMLL